MDKSIDSFLGKMIRGYSLEKLLGRGSVTRVYRAHTEELWQVPEIVITLLLFHETLSVRARTQFQARFTKEAKHISRLRHSALFPLYGFGEQEEYLYLLMPDVSGDTLALRLHQQQRWSPAEAFLILAPLTEALDYIHSQGLVYQFLNPANILLPSQGVAQITGLGLAQILRKDGLADLPCDPAAYDHLKNIADAYLGMPEYLAPEVVKGLPPDPRSDIYSLGILLFEMLSGKKPFSSESYLETAQMHVLEALPSFHDFAPDLPVALELVINRALHRDPERRFQAPAELLAAYAHVLDERLNVPRHFNLVQTVEQIRALPFPSASPNLALPRLDEGIRSSLSASTHQSAQASSGDDAGVELEVLPSYVDPEISLFEEKEEVSVAHDEDDAALVQGEAIPSSLPPQLEFDQEESETLVFTLPEFQEREVPNKP